MQALSVGGGCASQVQGTHARQGIHLEEEREREREQVRNTEVLMPISFLQRLDVAFM